MVDSINAAGNIANTRPVQKINWRECTANEILDYKGQGQEVPTEYVKWAQDVERLMNTPDDVTYEMANSSQQTKQSNAAQDMRQQMSDDGLSLKQQGEIFIGESKTAQDSTTDAIAQMAPFLREVDQLEQQAQTEAQQTQTKAEQIKAELDAKIADAKSNGPFKPTSAEDKGQIAGLAQVLQALQTGSTSKIGDFSSQLQDIDTIINEGAVSSQNSTAIGAETLDIGSQLLDQGKSAGKTGAIIGGLLTGGIGAIFGSLFGNSKRKVGKEAIQQGSETMTVGGKGTEISKEAAEKNNVTIKSIDQKVTKAEADTKADNTPQTPDTADTRTAQDTSEDPVLDPTLANTTIQTDPEEILKRKQRRGEA